MNYKRNNIVLSENNDSKSRGAYSAFPNSGWAHNTGIGVSTMIMKTERERVARNHDVSRQTANHNIIISLDHAILVLP